MNSSQIERRSVTAGTLDLDGAATGTGRVIRGTAIRFGALSSDLGGFVETFRPGSVRFADDLKILNGHDARQVLGAVRSGTARVWQDAGGVHFEVTPPATSYARDLAVLLERGDVGACSFAFVARDDTWHYSEELGTVVRTVLDAEVLELSVTALPAYPSTVAELA